MSVATESQGSAERWGPVWGARPQDWAISEDQHQPTYEAALQRLPLEPGDGVLDVGCGVGVFLRLVTDRGAKAFGLDASEALIELGAAESRSRPARRRHGVTALPDDSSTS